MKNISKYYIAVLLSASFVNITNTAYKLPDLKEYQQQIGNLWKDKLQKLVTKINDLRQNDLISSDAKTQILAKENELFKNIIARINSSKTQKAISDYKNIFEQEVADLENTISIKQDSHKAFKTFAQKLNALKEQAQVSNVTTFNEKISNLFTEAKQAFDAAAKNNIYALVVQFNFKLQDLSQRIDLEKSKKEKTSIESNKIAIDETFDRFKKEFKLRAKLLSIDPNEISTTLDKLQVLYNSTLSKLEASNYSNFNEAYNNFKNQALRLIYEFLKRFEKPNKPEEKTNADKEEAPQKPQPPLPSKPKISKTYYEDLGLNQAELDKLSPVAAMEIISSAYKNLVIKWHPDKNKSAEAAEKFRKIKEAYDILKNYYK